MHRLKWIIAVFVLAPALAASQEPAAEPVAPEDPAHQELRNLRDAMVDAFNKQDLDALLAHVAEDAVLTWQDAQVSRGRQGVRDYYQRMMTGDDRIVESVTATVEVDELTRLYGQEGETGLAFGRLDQDFRLTDGRDFHLSNRWTAHVVKNGGGWEVSAFHVSANLFDNPVLDLVMRQIALWAGGGSLAVGLILGLILGRLIFRRRATTAV
jgi:ketosteroid isomerase-like protein